MDRRLVHVGRIPLAEDWLEPQRNLIVALGEILSTVFGQQTVIRGLQVAPTQPTTMAVRVEAGSIFTMAPIDATSFGVLPADLASTMRHGMLAAVTLPIQAPTTPGYSRSYLVQVGFVEEDTDAAVLSYFNSANPAQPYSGPDNSGQAQARRRSARAVVQLKAGAPAPTGSQSVPGVDVGYIGLAVVTVANGATSVVANMITQMPTVPRPPSNLRVLRPGFSNTLGFTVPGTINWTVPAGVYQLRARIWGGGGGGSSGGGGSGAGGGYCLANVSVTPGQVIPITTGAGGAGAAYPATAGSGGLSSFGSYGTAFGGGGGGAALATGGGYSGGSLGAQGQTGQSLNTGTLNARGGLPPDWVGRGSGGNASGGTSGTGNADAGAHGLVLVEY